MEDSKETQNLGKEKNQPAKERHWQEKLLGAFLPQVPSEQETQPRQEESKSKVIVLSSSTVEERYVTLIKMSVLTSIFTAILLWFFEPSFVQVQVQMSTLRKTDQESYIYNSYTSKTLIFMWSILAGLFAFSVLFSIPE
jgi:hypothetical protein